MKQSARGNGCESRPSYVLLRCPAVQPLQQSRIWRWSCPRGASSRTSTGRPHQTLQGHPEGLAGRKSFTLVIKNPESPEMRVAVQKLFVTPARPKTAIAKLNESRVTVKIVGSDEELLRVVESTPGAVEFSTFIPSTVR